MRYLFCCLLMSCCCWGPPPVTPPPTPTPAPVPAPVPVPVPVPVVVVVDAGPDESHRSDCARACANMLALHCQGWEGSPGPDEVMGTVDDVPCTQTCTDYEVAAASLGSTAVSLHPKCIAAASSCMAAVGCFQ